MRPPLQLSQEEFDIVFEEIEPAIRESDGKELNQVKLRGTDITLVQDLMDQTFYVEVTRKPMNVLSSSTFNADMDIEKALTDIKLE